jgi:hypothetical protein
MSVLETAKRVAEWYRLRDADLLDAGLRSLVAAVEEHERKPKPVRRKVERAAA